MPVFTPQDLKQRSIELLGAAGATPAEAEIVGIHLVESNLAGHDSHGVLRIPQYAAEIERGAVQPGIELGISGQAESSVVVDGFRAFGQVACAEAMRQAIDKALAVGVGIASLRRCNHSGRLGAYVESAAGQGLVGVVMMAGTAGRWAAPFGGRVGRLGTNPLAICAPSGGPFPVLLDMSTCIAPEGKIRHHRVVGQRLPDKWLVDKNGRASDDPNALYDGGAILPLGGSVGHKGYAISFMIQVMAGALAGFACCPQEMTEDDVGHGNLLLLAIDIERFVPQDVFRDQVRQLIDYVKDTPTAEGFDEVLAPGEFEYRHRRQRSQEGIPVPDEVWAEVEAVGKST